MQRVKVLFRGGGEIVVRCAAMRIEGGWHILDGASGERAAQFLVEAVAGFVVLDTQ